MLYVCHICVQYQSFNNFENDTISNETKLTGLGSSIQRDFGEIQESGKVMFKSDPQMIMNNGEIMLSIKLSHEEVLADISRWVSQGSGWIIDHIEGYYLNVYKCNPLEGNSYIPLPKELQNPKMGLMNIQNDDKKCFLWCHTRHENLNVKNPQ